MSPEAIEALEDKTPPHHPWCFYPRGYPNQSPGFDTQVKKQKKKDWAWSPPKKKI